MKKFVAALIVIFMCAPLAACGGAETFRYSAVVLGDAIVLDVNAKGRGAESAVKEMFALADKVFGEMDLSDGKSTLSRFNSGSADIEYEISRHTYQTLTLAESVYKDSGGAFDVTSLPLSKLWRVDTDGVHNLRPDVGAVTAVLASSLPSIEQVNAVKANCGFDKISFYERGGKYYLTKSAGGAAVDLGGIAKGYFTDLCAKIAADYNLTSCYINLSGNIYLHGAGIKSGGDWTVGVINPRPRLIVDEQLRGYVAAIKCSGSRSFVSSGDYQRFYYYSDLPKGDIKSEAQLLAVCHIINPISGLPVGLYYDKDTDSYYNDYSAVCMAVVSGENSAKCDAIATAVCVLGLDEGAMLLQDRKSVV